MQTALLTILLLLLPLPPALAAPQVALDVQQHTTMAALQQRVSSRDKIVGWFSTGNPDVSRSRDALIHSFYGNECANPVSERARGAAGAQQALPRQGGHARKTPQACHDNAASMPAPHPSCQTHRCCTAPSSA